MPAKVVNEYVNHGEFYALLIKSSRSDVVCDCIIDSDIYPAIRCHRWRRISGDIVNSVGTTLLSEVKRLLFGEMGVAFKQIESGNYLRRCNFVQKDYSGCADHLSPYHWKPGNEAWKENFKNNFKVTGKSRSECFPFAKYKSKDETEVLPIRIQGGKTFNVTINKYLRNKVNKNMLLMNGSLYLYPEPGAKHYRGEPFAHGEKFINVLAKRVFGEFEKKPCCGWAGLPQETNCDFRVDIDNQCFVRSNLPRNKWVFDEKLQLWLLTISIVRPVNWKPTQYLWLSHPLGVFEKFLESTDVEVKQVRVATEQKFDDVKWEWRAGVERIVSAHSSDTDAMLQRYAAEKYGVDIGEYYQSGRLSKHYAKALDADVGNVRAMRKRVYLENLTPEDRDRTNVMYTKSVSKSRRFVRYSEHRTVTGTDGMAYLDMTRNNLQIISADKDIRRGDSPTNKSTDGTDVKGVE